MEKLNDWENIERRKIRKEFNFADFTEAIDFVNKVADLAEKSDHHPDIHIYYKKVVLELWTHSVVGLTEKDFSLAEEIDKL